MDSGKEAQLFSTCKHYPNKNVFFSSLLVCLTMTPRLTCSAPGLACIMWAPREHFTGVGASGSTFSRLFTFPSWCFSLLLVSGCYNTALFRRFYQEFFFDNSVNALFSIFLAEASCIIFYHLLYCIV